MDYSRILLPIKNAIRGLVGRAIVSAVRTESGRVVVDVSMAGNEKHSSVPCLGNYGLVSKPQKGSEIVVLFQGGARGNGVAVASVSKNGVPEIEAGEACLFSDFGQRILLKKDGSVVVKAATGCKVKFESDIETSGKVVVGESIVAGGDISAKGALQAVGDVAAKCQAIGDEFVEIPAVSVHLSLHTHECANPGSPSGTPMG